MSYENEPIVVQREVKAVAIPAGVEVNLKLGSVGYITQALGGSFTVYIDGNLFRIAGQDADAIGKTAATAPEVPPGASEEDIKNVVWQQLKTCYDPEIPVNIVDLGLVYECDVSKNEDATRTVDIKMTLTAPGCGMGEVLVQDVRDKVQIVPTVARANVAQPLCNLVDEQGLGLLARDVAAHERKNLRLRARALERGHAHAFVPDDQLFTPVHIGQGESVVYSTHWR